VRMVDTLMDVAEAESGTMRLQTAAVSVPDLVHDVVDMYEMVAEEKNVQLRTELPEHLEIEGDGDRLRQVLANLVDNAIKYSDGPGEITVTGRGEPGWGVIAVTDHGIGIASDDLPRIWDRLYRADRSRSKRGLGLGLNYVRAVVEAHGGTVAVDSALDQGSTFTVRLPR